MLDNVIHKKGIKVNSQLIKKHFLVLQTKSIVGGLRYLKNEIKQMSEDEIKNEKPDEIENPVEKNLEINNQNQKQKG